MHYVLTIWETQKITYDMYETCCNFILLAVLTQIVIQETCRNFIFLITFPIVIAMPRHSVVCLNECKDDADVFIGVFA